MADTTLKELTEPYRFNEISAAATMRAFSGFGEAPEPGEPLPDFDLMTTDGRRVHKADFAGRRPLLISFASLSCPMTAASSPVLTRLFEKYGRYVAFMSVYVREAHPGDEIPQAADRDEKLNHAVAYQRRDSIPWTVAVDELDGDFHLKMGAHPNTAFIVDDGGNIVYRSLWSTHERGLERALEALVSGRAPRPSESKPLVAPMLSAIGCMSETIDEAGPEARRQARRKLAPVYGLSRVARVFSPLPPAARGAAALGAVGVGVFGLIKALGAATRSRRR